MTFKQQEHKSYFDKVKIIQNSEFQTLFCCLLYQLFSLSLSRGRGKGAERSRINWNLHYTMYTF